MVILIFVIEEIIPMLIVLDFSFMEIFVIRADINYAFLRGRVGGNQEIYE